jgi:dUTP pyrophosphatase
MISRLKYVDHRVNGPYDVRYMQLKVQKLHPEARLPSYSHLGDAGMDLYAIERTILKPGERTAVRTGISMEIPTGHVGLIWDKNGLAIREGLKTLGGVIDASYRGEIHVGITNIGSREYVFEPGHKVAQLLFQKIEHLDIIESTELSVTSRGQGGFGSTGK